MSRTRSALYRWARVLGDVEAAQKGPSSYARRRLRRKGLASWNGLFRRLTRGL